jgi:hypothetical protein
MEACFQNEAIAHGAPDVSCDVSSVAPIGVQRGADLREPMLGISQAMTY